MKKSLAKNQLQPPVDAIVYDRQRGRVRKRSLLRDLVLKKFERALKENNVLALLPIIEVRGNDPLLVIANVKGRETETTFKIVAPRSDIANLLAQLLRALGKEVSEVTMIKKCEKVDGKYVIGRLENGKLEVYWCPPQ